MTQNDSIKKKVVSIVYPKPNEEKAILCLMDIQGNPSTFEITSKDKIWKDLPYLIGRILPFRRIIKEELN